MAATASQAPVPQGRQTHPPRSPSPPLQAPVSTEPGSRAQNLSKVFTGALNHTVTTCSYNHFASCFPTPAKYNKPLLESVWRQVSNMIETRSRREFDEILVEKEVIKGLNELDDLIHGAKGKRESGEEPAVQALHEVPPQQLFLAYLAPYLQETQAKLEGQMEGLKRQNEELIRGIQGQEEDVERLISGLGSVIADLEGGDTVLNGAVEDGTLREEAREIDSEIARRRDGKDSRL